MPQRMADPDRSAQTLRRPARMAARFARSMASSQASAPSSVPTAGGVLEQTVLGSRRLSNVLMAAVVSAGGLGFLLTSASSRLGRDLLPIGHPAALAWVPQGLVMGLYGLAAVLPGAHIDGDHGPQVGGQQHRCQAGPKPEFA